jgi:diphthamide synthase subunit DPH2
MIRRGVIWDSCRPDDRHHIVGNGEFHGIEVAIRTEARGLTASIIAD